MKQILNHQQMLELGQELATKLPINFCLELIGDVGVGKTTLVKGLISALNPQVTATSPSFVINNRYQINSQRIISHYDFYRLNGTDIIDQNLIEDLTDSQTGVVVEWADTVAQILPNHRWQIKISYDSKSGRQVEIKELK